MTLHVSLPSGQGPYIMQAMPGKQQLLCQYVADWVALLF